MPRKDPDARREYNRNYQRTWYREHRELHLQRVLRVTRRARAAVKHHLDRLKNKPCADSGVAYPPYSMDCDHVRGEKLANLSRLRGGRAAWDKILAEIDKCEVVCANCHRRRTYLRRTSGAP
jgi:hypothetical protein